MKMDATNDTPKNRTVWITLAVLMVAPLGAGLVSAGHEGAPGTGALDGWVDVHGDTMHGELTLQAPLATHADIRFMGESGSYRALETDDSGALHFGNEAVCTSGVSAAGCGDITAVLVGDGLSGGGSEGEVVVAPDFGMIQRRVVHPCPDGAFIQAISGSGAATCTYETTYSDDQAVAAVEAAGFAHSTDLASVATSGSALDLSDLSLDALSGSPCTFEGLDGVVTISFTSRGEIGLVCDAGIDFDTDAAHCGGANQPVPEWPNAIVKCSDGAPVLESCTSGFHDLDGNPTNGCESDTTCASHMTLVDGQCVDLATDPNHCGEPYNAVPEVQNAFTSCVDGSFSLSCNPGWANMDGNFDNGCETPEQFWYTDADGDGYGWYADGIWDFSQPAGYVENNLDCDDAAPSINPDATEIQGDGVDNDCDGWIE